jgi:hypothetical protein
VPREGWKKDRHQQGEGPGSRGFQQGDAEGHVLGHPVKGDACRQGERGDSATRPSDIAVEQLVRDNEGGRTGKQPPAESHAPPRLKDSWKRSKASAVMSAPLAKASAAASKGLGGLQ